MQGRALPIIADTPRLNPGLGFEVYGTALADAIRGGSPAQFTVGIYGAWGSGKSSLLNAVKRALDDDPHVVTAYFDAWRYEKADHIVVPLLHSIKVATDQLESVSVKKQVRDALLSVIRSITFTLGPAQISVGQPDAKKTDAQAIAELDSAFLKPYADMRAIGDALGNNRIVVLIDDLDRCSSDNVVALLEAINLVMDVPGFVFVLALDYDVLVNAVAVRYPHASGHVFVEKMVQVPFRVPRLNLRRESFLADLVPGWSDEAAAFLPAEFPDIAYEIATLGLEANPRQIKRFINSTLVLLRVAEEILPDVDARLLSGIVGLQLRWPAEYQDFADAVLAGDESPTRALIEAEDPVLAKYGGRFFAPDQDGESLLPLLNLTRVVVTPETMSGYETGDYDTELGGPADEIREAHRSRLIAALAEHGFTESERYRNAFYNPERKARRVKLGKTVVRFESRDRDGRWALMHSYLLTRQIDDAIAQLATGWAGVDSRWVGTGDAAAAWTFTSAPSGGTDG